MDKHGARLLVVDDEPANIFLLEYILNAEGYHVDTAQNGPNALEQMVAHQYDAVLLDIMMPQMSGLDVLKIAKQTEILKDVPIIIVSAKVQSSDVELAMELGAVEYIRKPIDEIELLARLKTVIKIRKQDLKLKLLYNQLQRKNQIITSSLEAAKKIQRAVFPTQADLEKFLPGSFIFFKPKDMVSGDFFWFTRFESKTIIIEGDCTGHGVPGAFLSLIGSSLLDKIIMQNRIFSPGKILDELNKDFILSLNRNAGTEEDFIFDGMDISVACIDTESKLVQLAAAGQDIIVIDKQRNITQISGSLFSIGYEMEALNGKNIDFEEHRFSLDTLSALILFSDGYIDQFGGPSDEKFMMRRFTQIFQNARVFNDSHTILGDQFENWKLNQPQTDDILVVGINLEKYLMNG